VPQKGVKSGLNEEEIRRRKKAIKWINDHQWNRLERLSKVPPFNKPNLVLHILDNTEQWLAYANAKDSDNLQMPGPYIEYDPVKEERQRRKKKARRKGALDKINEEDPNIEVEMS
jgi:hypothetical protein